MSSESATSTVRTENGANLISTGDNQASEYLRKKAENGKSHKVVETIELYLVIKDREWRRPHGWR